MKRSKVNRKMLTLVASGAVVVVVSENSFDTHSMFTAQDRHDNIWSGILSVSIPMHESVHKKKSHDCSWLFVYDRISGCRRLCSISFDPERCVVATKFTTSDILYIVRL